MRNPESPYVQYNRDEPMPPDDQKPPIQISNLPAILWRRLWVIALAIALALAGGVIYLRQATPVYRATNRLFVAKAGDNRITGESADAQTLSRSGNYRATQTEIMLSPLVLSKVAERPDIKAMKTFEKASNVGAALRAGLDVQFGADDLMNISFDTSNGSDAAPVANAVADAYIAFSDEYKKSSSAEVLQILQKEKQKLQDELSERLAQVTRFKMDSGSLALATRDKEGNTVLGASTTLKQINAFTDAMTRAQILAIEAKANLESIKNLKSDPKRLRQYMDTQRARGEAVASDPEELRLRAELFQLSVSRHEMEGKLSPGHPRYQSAMERMALIDQELLQYDGKFVQTQLAMGEENQKAAERQVIELAAYIQANGEDARKLNTQVAQFERLSAEMEQTRSRLDFLNTRIRELSMSQDVRAMNVMLVEAAAEPGAPFSPNSGKILKMSLAFGLILGLTLAVMMEFVDDRMRSADQMATVTGLPVLGVIPEIPAVDGQDVARAVERDPGSPMAEAIRGCRTAVLFGMPAGRAKTILITSPTPGDGKSTIAASLAESLAQSGKRTLLLDADLRKPRIERIFAIDSAVGLSSIVTGQSTIEQAIQKGPVANLDLIASGPIPPNPAELLNSEAFLQLIATLRDRYDHILIDTPPVLAVTDARIVAAGCDIVILVFRAEKCRQRAANHAKAALASVGARVLGIVVNAAPQNRSGYGDSKYGGYGYGYGYGDRYGRASETGKTTQVPSVKG